MTRLCLPICVVAALVSSGAAQDAVRQLDYQSEPRVLGPDAPRVFELIPDVEITTVSGETTRLSAVAGEKGLVIALRDPDCPLSKRYTQRLRQLEGELGPRGFGMLYVAALSAEDAARDIETHELGAPYAIDEEGQLAAELAAATTTEVFVLDAARTLAYRGMIDDQFGLGFAKPAADHEHLREALAAVEAGAVVEVPATEAQGCLLESDATPVERPVTWHNRISRIVQRKCSNCHHAGTAAPFPLVTYRDVSRRKAMIEWVVDEGIMPPWYAEEHSGPWRNDLGLSAAERADFVDWAIGGGPEGEPADAPLERVWTEGWSIGEPDLVVQIPRTFDVPAEGVVEYQYVYTQIDLPEDRWVQAFEIRPTAPAVVHHVLVFLESPDDEETFEGGIAGFFAGAVPGQMWQRFPDGLGKRLPKDAWLKFQLHYTPVGTAAVDQTEIGFVFADEPVHTEIQTTSAYSSEFSIPPHAFDHEVTAEYVFREPARILGLFPHAHLRGSRFLYELVYPGGETEDLLSVPYYDFNWQLVYQLANPRLVPPGTRMRVHGWYNNTAQNPANPDPDATVSFGEQTFEEMMIGYVNWVPAGSLAAAAPK